MISCPRCARQRARPSTRRLACALASCVPLLPLHGHAAAPRRASTTRSGATRCPARCCSTARWASASSDWRSGSASGSSATGPSRGRADSCQHCRYALAGTHPDIHWYFPRPRLKDGDASPAKIEDDFREAIGERVKTGAYAPPPPEDGHLRRHDPRDGRIRRRSRRRSAHRKVYILGEAERMVVREDAEEAAGAFLKLLEEPPTRTRTSSSRPASRVRSSRRSARGSSPSACRRSAPRRCRRRARRAGDARRRSRTPAVRPSCAEQRRAGRRSARARFSAGAEWADALARARRMLDAASGRDRREQMRDSAAPGSSKARGAFSTSLDALTALLHERVRTATERGKPAMPPGRGSRARRRSSWRRSVRPGNVNPQLITSELLRRLEELLHDADDRETGSRTWPRDGTARMVDVERQARHRPDGPRDRVRSR